MFFDLEPERALLGDLNNDLITTYRALKRDAALVCECLRRLPTGSNAYYRIRAFDPEPLSEPERAARFIYLNRNCFNGIYRTNQKGQFNVPYGPPRSMAKFDYERIMIASTMLRRATLLKNDFEVTLQRVQSGDFVYLDPPYAVAHRRIFAEYHPETFGTKDLIRLTSSLKEIDRRGAIFVISYADSREARELLRPWSPKRVRTRRHVAGFVGHRRHAYEIIASNLKEAIYAN